MKQNSTYPLRLPRSLKKAVTEAAKKDGTSMNQFIAMAVAEKLSALQTAQYFEEKKADLKAFKEILDREGGKEPIEGDEVLP